jgi:hypothetical protein
MTSSCLLVSAAFLLVAACAGSASGDRDAGRSAATPGSGTTSMAPMPHSSGATVASADEARQQSGARPDPAHTAVVYKDANCGCCTKWVDHIRDAGFTTTSHDVPDLNAVKSRYGVPRSLASCHTAEIGGYIVEGHVPADLIRKMLDEKPDIAGIAVPGMPVGSPGMEYTYTEPYDVIAFTRSGTTSIYAKR